MFADRSRPSIATPENNLNRPTEKVEVVVATTIGPRTGEVTISSTTKKERDRVGIFNKAKEWWHRRNTEEKMGLYGVAALVGGGVITAVSLGAGLIIILAAAGEEAAVFYRTLRKDYPHGFGY